MQLPKLSLPDKTSRKMLTELPLFSSFAALRCLICVRNWNSQNSSESSEVYMRWSDFCKILRENCKDISQITTKLLQLQRFLTLSKSADGQTNLERSQFISHKKNIWYYSRFPTQKNNSSWLSVQRQGEVRGRTKSIRGCESVHGRVSRLPPTGGFPPRIIGNIWGSPWKNHGSQRKNPMILNIEIFISKTSNYKQPASSCFLITSCWFHLLKNHPSISYFYLWNVHTFGLK